MKANEMQVAGTHYKTESGLQHWDMVVQYDLNYFEGQITKYAMRARRKNGKQDLLKCKHFLEKYLEVYDQMYPEHPPLQPRTTPEQPYAKDAKMLASLRAQEMLDDTPFITEGYYGDNTQAYQCKYCHEHLRAASKVEAYIKHPACAMACAMREARTGSSDGAVDG